MSKVVSVTRLWVGALACAGSAACSAILQFHDKPFEDTQDSEGGTLPDATTTEPDAPAELPDSAVVDVESADSRPPYDGPDAAPDPNCSHPCRTDAGTLIPKGAGSYCGNSVDLSCHAGLNNFIFCSDAGVAAVTPCGSDCFAMPDPHPDFCDPCAGHVSGAYCGKDLLTGAALGQGAGDSRNAVFRCNGGALEATVTFCTAGCTDGGCS
jgi:hypothetical protein